VSILYSVGKEEIMKNFVLDLPTRIYFGKGQIENLGDAIKPYGNKVLVVTGRSSAKKYGVFDDVVEQLERNKIKWVEYRGISPNPRLREVLEGIEIAKKENILLILAVGGGSVIDAAKTMAFGRYASGDIWDYFLHYKAIEKALPVGAVLTLSATGSEMNGGAVITNEEKKQKYPYISDKLKPRFSILDPTYTFSVPKNQTAFGIADIFSHVVEQYFSPTTDWWIPDRISEGILKTVIHWAPIAYNKHENYSSRANIMWASTMALNGIIATGKITDWATHEMEHELSAYYDIPHGEGLAVLQPYWMEYVLSRETEERFDIYGRNVWDIKGLTREETARKSIEETRNFFNSLGLPSKLSEVGIFDEYIGEMADNLGKREGTIGRFKELGSEDIEKIYRMAL
jgi:alcohol dehydrogenase YqhD (iron-dependent ADH family)